jgi:regulator of sirC expression with transglutaminase-like and TPR domain
MTASTPRPHYCNQVAYDLFARESRNLDAKGALLRAAVAVAMHDAPDTDLEQVERRIDDLAQRVLDRLRGRDPRALVAQAHFVLFDEEKFTGNTENYYDPGNSYLPTVLETRRGIPITLSLLYKEVLERVGVPVEGTNAPGHFLATVQLDGRPMIVDTFARGRVLSRREACDRIEKMLGKVDRDADLLPRATNVGWLLRILQNLEVVFSQSRRMSALAAMMELHHLLTDGADQGPDPEADSGTGRDAGRDGDPR